MPDYSFAIDNMTFSYSSVSSFETCAYGFKLNYIDAEERTSNFYADYGSAVHLVLEKYFRGELDREWLKDYFIENYPSIMKSDPPPFPQGIADKYYEDALWLFDDLPINRDDYEVIAIEEKYETECNGIKLVVKPDLIVKEKATGSVILWDYKSSSPLKKGEWDLKKIATYEDQLILYAYFVNKLSTVVIDKIKLLFVRLGKIYEIEVTPEKTEKVLKWFKDTVQKIRWEQDYLPNTKNKFWCSQLCSVRQHCSYWREQDDFSESSS